MSQNELEYFARCASGFEKILAQELKDLNMMRVRPLKGGVAFFGTKSNGYRACLWSRVATRIQVVLTRVPAQDASALYEHAATFAWERHVARGATIAVRAHGTNAQLRKTTFTALKVKDALCDHLRSVWGTRPDVDAKQPDVAVDVALHQEKATLFLNLSGASLHRRGYREDGTQTEAPLKETLAAGLLLDAGWPQLSANGGCLADPMCGSGTLAIEAALIATNQAPGLLRSSWGFEGWAQHEPALWEDLCAEARAATIAPQGRPRIVAGDVDERALAIAQENARRAHVEREIMFFEDDAANLARHIRPLRNNPAPGLLVANPPYGMRLQEQQDLPATYAALEAALRAIPRMWDVALITPDAGIDSALGRLPFRTLPCFNGPIEAAIRHYHASDAQLTHTVASLAGIQRTVPLADKNSAQFAARLRKVARERVRWAKHAQVANYRIYDADLPDYRFFVDRYEVHEDGNEKPFVYVGEYRRPARVSDERAAHRLADAAALIAAILDVPSCDVVIRPWADPKKGGGEGGARKRRGVASEGGLRYPLDLNEPQATLPLSQRTLRAWLAEHAAGKRVACLFSAGGAAYAAIAQAGARELTVVDATSSHLESVRALFRHNHLATKQAHFEQSDVRAWLRKADKRHATYDYVMCFAPVWLPAKDAGGKDWDLNKDLLPLLTLARPLLGKEGALVLVPETDAPQDVRKPAHKAGLSWVNLSERMVPADFERSAEKPTCWLFKPQQ